MYQDQSKLQQILTNLLSNAIKFTPEGGRITVSARGTPQGLIEISVSDTGVGIAATGKATGTEVTGVRLEAPPQR